MSDGIIYPTSKQTQISSGQQNEHVMCKLEPHPPTTSIYLLAWPFFYHRLCDSLWANLRLMFSVPRPRRPPFPPALEGPGLRRRAVTARGIGKASEF